MPSGHAPRAASPWILALDLGTTGNKATLFDGDGRVAASSFRPYPTHYPRSGWAEQNAADWWESACAASRELMASPGIAPGDVAAVGFSGHMMGCLPVDGRGEPLGPCLIHADARATRECDEMRVRIGDAGLYGLTGNRIAPQYPLPKIAWLARHRPGIVGRTAWFVQSKDYLASRFTGRCGVTDFSDASLTCLFDLRSRLWSGTLAGLAGIPVARLPEVVPSATILGGITAEAARATGLREGTPVVLGGGDGACATVGAGALAAGEAYNYGGGTSWVSMVTEGPVLDPGMRVFNLLGLDPARANLLGTMQCAGSAFEWFADRLGAEETETQNRGGPDRFASLGALAACVPAGSERLFFLPYLMGERSPIWDALARGAFIGLTPRHTRAHMARAVLEGIAYAIGSIVEILEEIGGSVSSMSLIGGLARGALFRRILAAVLGRRLILPADPREATSRGAAVAAAVAVGMLPSYEAARRWVPAAGEELPDPVWTGTYRSYARCYRGLYPALQPVFREIAGLPEPEPKEDVSCT